MNIDSGTLKQIREWRVTNDPLIPHARREAWLESTPDKYVKLTIEARRDRLSNLTETQPYKKATWTETTVFCFTRSMDAAIDQKAHLGAYQHAFEQMTSQEMPGTPDSLLPDSMEIITTSENRDLAESFRELIAEAQHRNFVETEYDELPFNPDGVPKAFWKKNISSPESKNTHMMDDQENNQVSLTDF